MVSVPKNRVLVVDDDPAMRDLVATHLSRHGYADNSVAVVVVPIAATQPIDARTFHVLGAINAELSPQIVNRNEEDVWPLWVRSLSLGRKCEPNCFEEFTARHERLCQQQRPAGSPTSLPRTP